MFIHTAAGFETPISPVSQAVPFPSSVYICKKVPHDQFQPMQCLLIPGIKEPRYQQDWLNFYVAVRSTSLLSVAGAVSRTRASQGAQSRLQKLALNLASGSSSLRVRAQAEFLFMAGLLLRSVSASCIRSAWQRASLHHTSDAK